MQEKTSSRASKEKQLLLLEFLITLSIVVIESAIFMKYYEDIKISHISEMLSSPLRLGAILSYILSVVLVPMTTILAPDFINKLVDIYKTYVIRSLRFESIEFAEKMSKVVPVLISLTLLFIIVGITSRLYQLLLFSIAPLAIYVILLFRPVFEVYNHNKMIEYEIPWFLVLLVIIESVNANIRLLIDRLRQTRILNAISRELLVIDRDSKLYTPSHVSALIGRASVTPNNVLSSVLAGYASRLRSGGNALTWLRSKIEEQLLYSEFSARLYSERVASIYGQLMLALYVILPLIAVAMLTINTNLPIIVGIIATPPLIVSIYVSRPKAMDAIPTAKLVLMQMLCLNVISAALYNIIGPHAIVLGWIVAVLATYRQGLATLKELDILERDSIEIIKMMIELRQSGMDVTKSLEYIVSSRTISSSTVKRIKSALSMVYQGIPLTVATSRIPSPSFLFKFTIFALGLIHECGGGDPKVFQSFYEYTVKLRTLKMNTARASKLFDVLALINIFVLVWIWRSLVPIRESLMAIGLVPQTINIDYLYLSLYTSLLGYSLASSTIRWGTPVLEARSLAFILAVILTIPFLFFT